MEPVGLVGLTIAVLDQLWKIGEKTADLVSNFREFDSDAAGLRNKIQDENNRMRAIRLLLFEPSSVYGGASLFEQFDSDVQEQIRIFLEEASDILAQAYQTLTRRQESSANENEAAATAAAGQTILDNVLSFRRLPQTITRLRWSFRDKKRIEGIVRDFADLNSRIHENIKLWCLGTSLGVNLQHLQRLENDANSKILGYDVDTRLRMAVNRDFTCVGNLELQRASLTPVITNSERFGANFGLYLSDGKTVLVEYRNYAADSPVPVAMDDRTRTLVNNLASLLNHPKEADFRTPYCQGWVADDRNNRTALVFNIPNAADPSPSNLLWALTSGELEAPSISCRFHLAASLARSISHLQLVKWVHQGIRSENILFFPQADDGTTHPSPTAKPLKLTEPWLMGFETSRPESFFSSGLADMELTRNIYRHPDRQGYPSQPFNKIHDIYALGVVLLEIGLWQPALSLDKGGFAKVPDPRSIQKHLVKHAKKRLGSKMGERYRDLVVKCLTGSFAVTDDTKEDLKLQQAFRSQVVDVLQRAAEYV